LDLGEFWADDTSLPLPLGLNVIRRDIDESFQKEALQVHHESIKFALNNKQEALEYALEFGRGMANEVAEQFVLMYVNDLTVNLGEKGVAALKHLFSSAYSKGLIDQKPKLDILEY